MTNKEAVIWLTNVTADIGKAKHSDLWHYEQALSEIKEMLESQPERKKGKWVEADSQCGIGCPFCGTPVDDFCSSIDYIDLSYEPNFCPNCGADMREPFTIPTEIIESVIGYDD